MKRMLFLGLVLVLIGIWFGLNIANDRPLLSNPFQEEEVREKARQKADELYERSKDLLLDQSKKK
ncbi:MAG TPA: hypothetical protein VKA64_04110 [Gammaproteobacteria bacterium]|nr:hypothetical protein [Gammaproteobacteria bacterium]